MAFKKRRVEGLVLDSDHCLGNAVNEETVQLGLGAKYARLVAIRGRNWASSAKAGAGADTATKLRIKDANDDIVFLTASDQDWATAERTDYVVADDTATGVNTLTVDQTGVAVTAGASAGIIVQSPVRVYVVNGGTATDFFTVDLIVEV